VEGMSLGELQSHIPVDIRWDSKFE
jgi:hypothetical protein